MGGDHRSLGRSCGRVVGGSGVEDGVGCGDGSGAGGVLLCTGLEEGDGGVEEGDTGVELGVVITEDGVEGGGAEEGEGSVAVIPANGSRRVPSNPNSRTQ